MERCDIACLIVQDGNETSFLTVATFVSSTLGIALSIFTFILLILTAVIFAEWRQSYKNQLIIQFMLSRIFYITIRYIYEVADPDMCRYYRCVIHLDQFWLAYTEGAFIAWMFVFSKHMSDSLVKVFDVPNHAMWKLSVCTWTIPCIVTSLIYIVFRIQTSKDIPLFILYLFLLKWPMLCANAIFLIQALLAILNTNQSRTENNPKIIIVMIVLIFAFSFQQILVDTFKILHVLFFDAYSTLSLTILNIIAIYQCAFSITFWVFGNKNTRKLWKNRNSKKLTSQLSVRSEQAS